MSTNFTSIKSTCAYNNCHSKKKTNIDLAFFSFPIKDERRTRAWVENCGNKSIALLDSSSLKHKLICERHFSQSDILVNSTRKLLTKHSVPLRYEETACELSCEPVQVKTYLGRNSKKQFVANAASDNSDIETFSNFTNNEVNNHKNLSSTSLECGIMQTENNGPFRFEEIKMDPIEIKTYSRKNLSVSNPGSDHSGNGIINIKTELYNSDDRLNVPSMSSPYENQLTKNCDIASLRYEQIKTEPFQIIYLGEDSMRNLSISNSSLYNSDIGMININSELNNTNINVPTISPTYEHQSTTNSESVPIKLEPIKTEPVQERHSDLNNSANGVINIQRELNKPNNELVDCIDVPMISISSPSQNQPAKNCDSICVKYEQIETEPVQITNLGEESQSDFSVSNSGLDNLDNSILKVETELNNSTDIVLFDSENMPHTACAYANKVRSLTSQIVDLKRKVKASYAKCYRLKEKQKSTNTIINELLETKSDYVNTFVRMQLFHQERTQWSYKQKQLALLLYKKSSSTYRYMVHDLKFDLPSIRTIQTWLQPKSEEQENDQ